MLPLLTTKSKTPIELSKQISLLAICVTILLGSARCLAQADTPAGIPNDPDGFLAFLNKTSPLYIETDSNEPTLLPPLGQIGTAQAYYAAIDPTKSHQTLIDFRRSTGLDLGADASAVYINNADLGFGRRMTTRVNPDGSVTSCVENYGGSGAQFGKVDAPLVTDQVKLDNAKLQRDLVATVCMEYSGTPGAIIAPVRTLIASNDNYSTTTKNSRITWNLAPGRYRLVAATALTNKSGSFTLKAARGGVVVQSLTGKWNGSGGKSYTSVKNPSYALDVKSTGSYTVDLGSSTVDSYLYLVQVPPNEQLSGTKFTKFYAYGHNALAGTDNLVASANLDGRGAKAVPGLCNVCHGGAPKSLVNGVYPDAGNTNAQFLPWDLDTFVYDTVDPSFSRAVQEPQFKKFNQAVLATYPAAKTRSWVGSATIPDADGLGTSVSIPLTVSGVSGPVTKLTVSIDGVTGGLPGIQHPNMYELNAMLVSPSGKSAYAFIASQLVASAANMTNAYFLDEAAVGFPRVSGANGSILSVPPFKGSWIGTNGSGYALDGRAFSSAFNGENPNGTWTLVVTDVVPGNQGTVNGWSLHFEGVPEAVRVPAPVELIRGWYGGATLPSATFNGNFVPAGWLPPAAPAGVDELYLKVIGPTCRACHAQRGSLVRNELDFSSYAKFLTYASKIESLVFDKGLMPLARRTYQNHFWADNRSEILAKFIPNFTHHVPGSATAVLKPGRVIANAGVSRTGSLAVLPNTPLALNGSASLFATSYNWSLVSKPLGSATVLSNATLPNPTITPDLDGTYQFELRVANGGSVSAPSTVSVEASTGSYPPISFANNIWAATQASNVSVGMSVCWYSCHNGSNSTSFPYRELSQANRDETYAHAREQINLLDPMDSVLLRKNMGVDPHVGGPTYLDYKSKGAVMQRWILEGAENN